MNGTRQQLLDWAEQGRLDSSSLVPAFQLAGGLPSKSDWRAFLDYLLLGLGALMLGTGVVFFFAYNWNELGRFAKFGLIESIILAALLLLWKLDLDRLPGKAALLTASLFAGVLLALVGQTYQTGADTYELFAAWAVMILPWVLVGRSAVMWLFWLLLVNTACYLYLVTFRGVFGLLFSHESLLWPLFALNTFAWALWALLAWRGMVWLRATWSIRVLATASGGLITALAIFAIIDRVVPSDGIALMAWATWLAAVYHVYRRWSVDAYILAGGVLSIVLVAATFTGRLTIDSHQEAGGFLLTGIVIIVLSALGGNWLKGVVTGGHANES